LSFYEKIQFEKISNESEKKISLKKQSELEMVWESIKILNKQIQHEFKIGSAYKSVYEDGLNFKILKMATYSSNMAHFGDICRLFVFYFYESFGGLLGSGAKTLNIYFVPHGHKALTWVVPQGHFLKKIPYGWSLGHE